MFDSGCGDNWGAAVHGGLQRGPNERVDDWFGRCRTPPEHRDADCAYIAGYEWALWDYEDANGLSHHRETNKATG